jgi:hypothetical protein
MREHEVTNLRLKTERQWRTTTKLSEIVCKLKMTFNYKAGKSG